MAKDNNVDATNGEISLFAAHPWVAKVKGIGKVTCAVLDEISATGLKSAKSFSEWIEECLMRGRQVIVEKCFQKYTDSLRTNMDEFLKAGASKNWTAKQVICGLNRIVGAQHALDGKLWEALFIIGFSHFLGPDNISIGAQVPTGSKLRGLTDIEVNVGSDRFLFELTSCLGSNWKKCLPEHCVDGEQQPFFLVTPSFNLTPAWIDEMKAMNCQPVAINSVMDGVLHVDGLITALKKEIEKAKQNKTSAV